MSALNSRMTPHLFPLLYRHVLMVHEPVLCQKLSRNGLMNILRVEFRQFFFNGWVNASETFVSTSVFFRMNLWFHLLHMWNSHISATLWTSVFQINWGLTEEEIHCSADSGWTPTAAAGGWCRGASHNGRMEFLHHYPLHLWILCFKSVLTHKQMFLNPLITVG